MNHNRKLSLNLRQYIGDRSDAIKDFKAEIGNYLKTTTLPEETRKIYSAIYNAISYYQTISDLSISGESAQKTFLENTISEFNKDYQYLSEKYNSKNPCVPPVIQSKGRIKSPISAIEKILSKVSEYVQDDQDLTHLNDSLRDFIGLRIIIDPPTHIKAQGKKAESDFCYEVFNDLLTHRGITRQTRGKTAEDTDHEFIFVNTVHDPHKLEAMKNRPAKYGFQFDPKEVGVYIPDSRPKYVEEYDQYFKDYKIYPKHKLYQRLHICAYPCYSKSIPEANIPSYIIPPTANTPSIEYQFCSADEENFAEYGKAAHTIYKTDRTFHRLGIPLFMKVDENTNKIRLTRLDESMETFYGYSFKSLFNIDYQTFLNTFDSNTRDEILAGNKKINFNEETQEYELEPCKKPLFLDTEDKTLENIKNLFSHGSKEEIEDFYEQNGLLDGTIHPDKSSTKTLAPQFEIFEIEPGKTPELDLNKNKNLIH